MIEILDLTPDDHRIAEVIPVMRELRTELTTEQFHERYRQGYEDGYRVVALFDEGECRAAAGYRLMVNFVHGLHLYVDDLVTAPDHRSRGYGKQLSDWLVERARTEGCSCVTLDSRVDRNGAHRFYLREGYPITSFHFTRDIDRTPAVVRDRDGMGSDGKDQGRT